MTDLLLDIQDGVATVTLNRPEKKNALSEAVFEGLPKVAQEIGETDGIRAVILTGAGGAFSAGIDLGFLQSLLPKLDEIKKEMAGPTPNLFQRPCTCWADLNVPVIAAIEGICIGGGMQLALGADIRIAHPDTKFSIMEAKWGLIPDMGITQFLPKLMRADQAKELMMTARMITAEEAFSAGLITRIADDPMAAAQELAAEIATRSPEAVAGAKTLVDSTWATAPGEGLAVEGALQANLIGTPNQMESVMSGMMKRDPKFS